MKTISPPVIRSLGGRLPQWVGWVAGGILLGITLGMLVIPRAVAWRLEGAVRAALPAVRVDVSITPSPRLLSGHLDRVAVEARRGFLGTVPFERLVILVPDVVVDLRRLVLGGQLEIVSNAAGEGSLEVRQEDFERYLAAVKGVGRATVALDNGVMTIEGDVKVLAFNLRVRAEGILIVSSPRTVDLRVRTLSVSGMRLPSQVGNALVSSLNPILTLDRLPVPVRIAAVVVDDGRASLTMRIDPRP